MELLQGSNLRDTLAAEGRMSVIETFAIAEQLCAALTAAHAAGVIHRDLKAENVLVGYDRRVVLVDFGLAKLLEPDPGMPGLTTTQQILGTLVTMAPEQIRGGAVDQRTDIYGLGVLIYNMLTGTVPFRGAAEEIMRLHLECPPRPPSAVVNLPAAIDDVVLRCLEKDPNARFPTVAAFLEAFRAAAFGTQAPTRQRNGIGLLVHAVAEDGADEDALTDAALALDEAEAQLADAGYQIPLRTSREVLGVLLAPAAPDEELAARRAAIDLGHALHGALVAMVPRSVRVAVTINSGDVHVRDGTSDILGGKLLEVPDWSWNHDSVVVTARANAGLPRT
jgi:eukaryotic-like serine/threonine-protein kinase